MHILKNTSALSALVPNCEAQISIIRSVLLREILRKKLEDNPRAEWRPSSCIKAKKRPAEARALGSEACPCQPGSVAKLCSGGLRSSEALANKKKRRSTLAMLDCAASTEGDTQASTTPARTSWTWQCLSPEAQALSSRNPKGSEGSARRKQPVALSVKERTCTRISRTASPTAYRLSRLLPAARTQPA